MHFLNLLDTLRVGVELLEAFLDELADDLAILFNAVLQRLSQRVLKAAEQRVDARFERDQVYSYAVDFLLVRKLLELAPLLLEHFQVVNPVLDPGEVLFNVLMQVKRAQGGPMHVIIGEGV